MRKLMLVLLLIMFSSSAFAVDSVYNRSRSLDADGWTVIAWDEDIDSDETPEMIQDPASFAQLAAEDEVEIISTYGNTTQTVTIYGVNNRGKLFEEEIELNGNLAATSVTTARYITKAIMDSEATDTVVIRRESGDTFIMSIPPSRLETPIGQYFNGTKTAFVTGWGVQAGTATDSTKSATATVLAALRWYPDDADCLDSGDGYQVVDSIFTHPYNTGEYKEFANPFKLEPGGWLSVFAKSGGEDNEDNQKANIRVDGYLQ